MIFPIQALINLQQLRQDWQEDAGFDYPGAVTTELLILYDVCKALDLNVLQAKEILGEVGFQAVNDYINAPTVISVDEQKIAAKIAQCH